MKHTMSKAVWGVFFVLLGVALAGRAVGVFDFNLFFPGWWTLFIIVPSAIGLVNSENRTASVFGLGIGILLLCSVQHIIDWYTFPRLIIALIFVVIGCSFLFRKDRSGHGASHRDNSDYYQGEDRNDNSYGTDNDYNQSNSRSYSNSGSQEYESGQYNSQDNYDNQSGSNSYERYDNDNNSNNKNSSNGTYDNNNSYNYGSNNNQGTNHRGYNQYFSLLSGRNVQFIDEEFTGAVVTSILGNVQLDLRNAYINDDVVIETTCVLGGVDIYVPGNIKVVIHCTPILGGVENKVITPYAAANTIHTIFIKGTCILGGIEVR